MHIDTRIPKYLWLQDRLRARISSGAWLPGQAIPSEIRLAEEYAVSTPTMGRALSELAREGLLVRVRGRGTCVATSVRPADSIRVAAPYEELPALLQELSGRYPFLYPEPEPDLDRAQVRRCILPALHAERDDLMVLDEADLAASDFLPQALDAVRVDGRIRGVPLTLSPYVAVLNLDLWALGCAEAPSAEAGWDWAEFEARLRALAPGLRPRGARPLALSGNLGRVLSFVFQAGGRWLCRVDGRTRSLPGDAETRAGLAFFHRLFRDDELTLRPEVDVYHAADSERAFMEGRVATGLFAAGSLRRFRGLPFAWNCVELPRGRERASALAGDAWCLRAACSNREWGRITLQALNAEPAQARLFAAGGNVPARKILAARAAAEAPPRERAVFAALPFARGGYGHASPLERNLVMGALEDFLENRLDLDGFCRHLETVLGAYRRHALAPRGDEFEA